MEHKPYQPKSTLQRATGGKFDIFLARARSKNTAQNLPKHAISNEKYSHPSPPN